MNRDIKLKCVAEEQRVLSHYYEVAMAGHDPFMLSATKAELQREAAARHKRMLARLLALVESQCP